MNGYTTMAETPNATLAAADPHGPVNGVRSQLIRRFRREGAVSGCWWNKTICKSPEPPSCFRRRAKVLGLLIPASCFFHVRAHPYHTELCKHSGIVGRA